MIDEFERTALALRDELTGERDRHQQRANSALERAAAIQQEIDGLESALRFYRQKEGIEVAIEVDEDLRQRFLGMDQKQVLIEIARERGGDLLAAEVIPTMIRAAVASDKRGAANAFYRTTGRFPEVFEKIRRGAYRLRDWDGELSVVLR